MGALSALLWCVLNVLCNTTHVKTVSLTTFGLCSIERSTLNLLTNIPKAFSTIPFCLCRSFSLLFSLPCELPSAVAFCHPWHQGKGVITQQEIVQIWFSLPQGFRRQKPASIFSLLKICASDEDLLDLTSTQRNLYSALTRASSTRGKKPL